MICLSVYTNFNTDDLGFVGKMPKNAVCGGSAMGIIMIIICVNKCVYLFSILIISRRGLRSPSEIISSLSNTLSQYVSSLFDVRRSVLHGGPKIMILKRCLWCYCLLFSKVVERVHSGHSNECGPAPRVRQPMDRFVTLRLNLCGLFGHHLGGG